MSNLPDVLQSVIEWSSAEAVAAVVRCDLTGSTPDPGATIFQRVFPKEGYPVDHYEAMMVAHVTTFSWTVKAIFMSRRLAALGS